MGFASCASHATYPSLRRNVQREAVQLDMFEAERPAISLLPETRKVIEQPAKVWLSATEQMLTRPQPCRITKQGFYVTYIINEN